MSTPEPREEQSDQEEELWGPAPQGHSTMDGEPPNTEAVPNTQESPAPEPKDLVGKVPMAYSLHLWYPEHSGHPPQLMIQEGTPDSH